MICIFAFIGCTRGIRFFVCPNQYADEMKTVTDIGLRREILVGSDLRTVIVHLDEKGAVVPVEHFRPEHTFSHRIHPLKVSYEEPMTLTTLIVIKRLQKPIGVAIRHISETNWRVYWLKETDIKDLKNTGVVYLPSHEGLPLLQN